MNRDRLRKYPEAVIFDFDGVILESNDIKTDAFIDVFAAYPQHHEAIRRFHLENLGISRYRKFDWIYSELLDIPLEEEEKGRLGEAFAQVVVDKVLICPFVPGAVELLQHLHGRSPMFVASGTPQEELEHVIRCRGIHSFFAEVWGTPPGKEEILRSILTRHLLSKNEVLFVGDGLSDYEAAKEVGVPFVARMTEGVAVDWHRLGVRSVQDLNAIRSLLELNGSRTNGTSR